MAERARAFVRVRGLAAAEHARGFVLASTCTSKEVRLSDPIASAECRGRADGVVDDTHELAEHNALAERTRQQEAMLERVGGELIAATHRGCDALLLAVGASGSGKTYSLVGARGASAEMPSDGLAQWLLRELLSDSRGTPQILLTCYELYEDALRDRLAAAPSGWAPSLAVREGFVRHHFIDGLASVAIVDAAQARHVVAEACRRRALDTLSTGEDRRRTTCVYEIAIVRVNEAGEAERTKITLVDAASELVGAASKAKASSAKAKAKAKAAVPLGTRAFRDVVEALAQLEPPSTTRARALFGASTLTQLLRSDLERSVVLSLVHVAPAVEHYAESAASCGLLKKLRAMVCHPESQWRSLYDEGEAAALAERMGVNDDTLLSGAVRLNEDARQALIERMRFQMQLELTQRQCELQRLRDEAAVTWDARVDAAKASVREAHHAADAHGNGDGGDGGGGDGSAAQTAVAHLLLLHPDPMYDRVVRFGVTPAQGLIVVGRDGVEDGAALLAEGHTTIAPLLDVGVAARPCSFALAEAAVEGGVGTLFLQRNRDGGNGTVALRLNGAPPKGDGPFELFDGDTVEVGCGCVLEVAIGGGAVRGGGARAQWSEIVARGLPASEVATVVRHMSELRADIADAAKDDEARGTLQRQYNDAVKRIALHWIVREASLLAIALGHLVRFDVVSPPGAGELVVRARSTDTANGGGGGSGAGVAAREEDDEVDDDDDGEDDGVMWTGANLNAFATQRIHTMRALYRARLVAASDGNSGAAAVESSSSSTSNASAVAGSTRGANPFAVARPIETTIGKARLWLNALALLVDIDESLAVVGYRGDERGSLAVSVHIEVMAKDTGLPMKMDPELVSGELRALVGHECHLNFIIHSCNDLPEQLADGVFVRALFFRLGPNGGKRIETAPAEGVRASPRFEHRGVLKMKITVPLVQYLRNEALEFEIVGRDKEAKASTAAELAARDAAKAEAARALEAGVEIEVGASQDELISVIAELERRNAALERAGGSNLQLTVARKRVEELEVKLEEAAGLRLELARARAEADAAAAKGSKVCTVS